MKSIYMRSAEAIRMLGYPLTSRQLKELTARQKSAGDYHVRFTPSDIKQATQILRKEDSADSGDRKGAPFVFVFAATLAPGGASSVAANVAYLLAKQGRRVLAIDCDPLGQLTSLLAADVAKPATTIFDVLECGGRWKQSRLQLYDNACLDLVCSPLAANLEHFQLLAGALSKSTRNAWKELVSELGHDYEVIIIDTGNSQLTTCRDAATQADSIVVVVDTQEPAAIALGQIAFARQMCGRRASQIVVANRHDPSSAQCRETLLALRDRYTSSLCALPIPDYPGFSRQSRAGDAPLLLAEEESNTSAVSAMLALSREMLARLIAHK